MTEQAEGAEVLADFAEWHTGPPNDIYVLQGHQLRAALAARESAAEVRGAQAERARRMDYAAVKGYELGYVEGAQAVLAAVAADWPEDGMTRAEAQHFLAARAAAAVTTSSAKSSDLATRVPQDESQHAAGGGGETKTVTISPVQWAEELAVAWDKGWHARNDGWDDPNPYRTPVRHSET